MAKLNDLRVHSGLEGSRTGTLLEPASTPRPATAPAFQKGPLGLETCHSPCVNKTADQNQVPKPLFPSIYRRSVQHWPGPWLLGLHASILSSNNHKNWAIPKCSTCRGTGGQKPASSHIQLLTKHLSFFLAETERACLLFGVLH